MMECEECGRNDVVGTFRGHHYCSRHEDNVKRAEEIMEPCDCSEDDGPCELHSTMWVVREGASTRTADELALCLIDDLLDIAIDTNGRVGGELSPWGKEIVDAVRADLDPPGHRWLEDPDLESNLFEVANQVENSSGLWITHEDGYVIAEVTGGPLQ